MSKKLKLDVNQTTFASTTVSRKKSSSSPKMDQTKKNESKDVAISKFIDGPYTALHLSFPSAWVSTPLVEEFKKPYWNVLVNSLNESKNEIYPPLPLIFKAMELCSPATVRAIILGQDPYYTGCALGVAFAVSRSSSVSESLANIYKEISTDLKGEFVVPNHGDISCWGTQGVLLLNSTLTVDRGSPNSHEKFGWTNFTDHIISYLSETQKNLVFILWGKNAKDKKCLIDKNKHLILEAAHPSPRSAHSGFFGCRHFSKTNEYLVKNGKKPINWNVTP